ncbi:MAG: hypothetical protein WD042_01505 [Phycisphaeraceae bacterium]
MHHYCTYFDHRYLPRGLALYRSLRQHERAFHLHVLCLDDQAHATLAALRLPHLTPVRLAELEHADLESAATRRTRSLVEYYFTCTAAFTRHVLRAHSGIDVISYVDADLYFFADPRPVFDELADGSVLIIPHRYPEALRHYESHGIHNVGLVSFRNDARGLAVLDDWRERCIQWCYERVEPGRYADQKYLDAWPDRFDGVVVSQLPGANLAPWNLPRHEVHSHRGHVLVDGQPLIFYHFHRLKVVRPYLFDPGVEHYGASLTPTIANRIYAPYLRTLRRCMGQATAPATGNLRLTGPPNGRELMRLLIYNRTMLCVGPMTTAVHLEPLARPLLQLRHWWQRDAA